VKKNLNILLSWATYLNHVSIELWQFFLKLWSNYGYRESQQELFILAFLIYFISFVGNIYIYIATENKFKHPSVSLATNLNHVGLELWQFFLNFGRIMAIENLKKDL
jgi:hypothetical protein